MITIIVSEQLKVFPAQATANIAKTAKIAGRYKALRFSIVNFGNPGISGNPFRLNAKC
jgi:hypothetical protein